MRWSTVAVEAIGQSASTSNEACATQSAGLRLRVLAHRDDVVGGARS
jgi:hypothetical protein